MRHNTKCTITIINPLKARFPPTFFFKVLIKFFERHNRIKIENMCKKYKWQATFYYIWDMDNLLGHKDSPFDRGKEVFEELYKHRIKVR